MSKTKKVNKSADSGKFVSNETAKANPKETVTQTVAAAPKAAKPKAAARKPVELNDEEKRALELEAAEKDYVDPHAEQKAKMAAYGTMSEADQKELEKALAESE